MTDKQHEALRLAELLELAPEDGVEPQTAEDAAAELRRQHTRIAELEARIKAMAEEHADELMVAHLDGRMRAPQPAGARQPGDERAAFEQWSKVTNQGYDLARNVSGKLQTFESTETEHAWRGFFHGLRASHGQAPAQAAPKQEAQEPVAWYVTGGSRLLDEDEAKAEARHIGGTAMAIPLYTVPQPPPTPKADSVLEDAARLDWLESNSQINIERVRYLGATKSIYEVTPYDSISYDGETLRAAIDAARAAQEGKSHG